MILLNKGANPSAENAKGETVLDLLSGHTLELLAGTEVEEAAQYILPVVEALPIVPNYIKHPEFPYTKKDSAPSVLPSSTTASPKEKAEGEAKLNEFFKGLSDKMKKEKEREVASPTEAGSGASSPKPNRGVAVELRQAPNQPIRITQVPQTRPVHMSPQLIPNPMLHQQVAPNPQQIVPNPQFQRQFVPYRHTTYQGQTYGAQNTQPRFVSNNVQIAHIEPYHPNNPIPVQHRTYNSANNPTMYNTPPPHYQMVPVQQHPGMQSHMLSRLPSVTPITPPPLEDKGFTTPTKAMSPTSPNSTQSTPPAADATLKVRLSGTTDFFEVDLCEIGESYTSLVKCFAEELELDEEKVWPDSKCFYFCAKKYLRYAMSLSYWHF